MQDGLEDKNPRKDPPEITQACAPLENPSTDSAFDTLGSSQKLTPIAQDQAYARRCEIVENIVGRLEERGLNIRTNAGSEYETILAMTANSFMPEYFCTILDPTKKSKLAILPGGQKEVLNSPDIKLQQDVCRYFRQHPELEDTLAENFALSLYLGHPLFWMGNSAIELKSNGVVQAGDHSFRSLNQDSGTIFIPGCGVTSFRMIQEFLAKQPQTEGEDVAFLLCDNHPFVEKIATRYCRYLADDRVQFQAASMDAVDIPDDTRTVYLSYVEAAGVEAITKVLSSLRVREDTQISIVAGSSPHEYSALSARQLVDLCEAAGFKSSFYAEYPSFSTHLVVDDMSVDFLDLDEAQALGVFSLSLSGQTPNTRTIISHLHGTNP